MIDLLSVLEGQVQVATPRNSNELPEWAEHIAARLTQDGLLQLGAGSRELSRVFGDLNQRLRYVLGEHDDPHASS